MRWRFEVLFLCCSLFCIGCREKSEGYFLKRGVEVQQELVTELMKVQSLQDLLSHEESLSSLFDELSFVAIQADRWKKKHKRKADAYVESDTAICLEQEFRRVLAIPGAEAFLEKCQKKAVERLDIYISSCTELK